MPPLKVWVYGEGVDHNDLNGNFALLLNRIIALETGTSTPGLSVPATAVLNRATGYYIQNRDGSYLLSR